MIDTLYLALDEEISSAFLAGIQANEPFRPPQMPGFNARIETTKPGSHYHRFHRADFRVTLKHENLGIELMGPVNYDRGLWHSIACRLNIPRLAGLPMGCLPDSDGELQAALSQTRAMLSWLPSGWMQRAKIKELHFAMNFDFNGHMAAHEIMGAHELMRHSRVRTDPRKFKEHHHTLYWNGKDTTIALYNKTREVCDKLGKRDKCSPRDIQKRFSLPELLRLEFRLKSDALTALVDRITPAPPPPRDGGPPMPTSPTTNLRVDGINVGLLAEMFRDMAFEFGDLPRRTAQRLTVKTFAAMLHQKGFAASDGTPVIEYAARHMNDRQIKEVKSQARTIDAGGPVFRWADWLGESGWGPQARPKPKCFTGVLAKNFGNIADS